MDNQKSKVSISKRFSSIIAVFIMLAVCVVSSFTVFAEDAAFSVDNTASYRILAVAEAEKSFTGNVIVSASVSVDALDSDSAFVSLVDKNGDTIEETALEAAVGEDGTTLTLSGAEAGTVNVAGDGSDGVNTITYKLNTKSGKASVDVNGTSTDFVISNTAALSEGISGISVAKNDFVLANVDQLEVRNKTFLETVAEVNGVVNGLVWGTPALILLGFVGVLMTILTKFFQLSHIKHWFGSTIGAIFKNKNVTKHTSDKQISQFQSLCTALAATVGTGNIAGVASAIATGGPGAVFWMWIVAFFGMMTNFSENVLGILYRIKNKDDEWSGGAMYYLRYGLGSKKGCGLIGKALAVIFCIFCLLASFGIGNMTQINTIATNMNTVFHAPRLATGIVLMLIAGLIILGGLKRIVAVTEKIVPFMVVFYIIGTVIICCIHITRFGEVFAAIFRGAFGFKAIGGAFTGTAVKMAVQMGMKRGVFSNEAGLGSSVMVHSNSNVKEPVLQGMWGIFEVFADTIIVCSLTAFSLLSSGIVDLSTGELSAAYAGSDTGSLVGEAFRIVFHGPGAAFVAIALLLFAFSTCLGWSHYGSKAFEYLFGTSATVIYKVIFVIAIIGGATMGENLAWDLSDTFNGLMMLPNLIGVLVLSPIVYRCVKNYVDRYMRGKDVKPILSMHPEIQKVQEEALKRDGQ